VTFRGAAFGSTTLGAGGRFEAVLEASSPGQVRATATDPWGAILSEATVTVSVNAPQLDVRLSAKDLTCVLISGTVSAEDPEGLEVRFAGLPSLEKRTVKTDNNGTFSLRIPPPPDGTTVTVQLTDWWGQKAEAIAEYQQAVRLQPQYLNARYNIAFTLLDKGQPDEAIAALREAIRVEPDEAASHINLGNALSDQGQLDEAIAEFREAFRLKPDDADYHRDLGSAVLTQGQFRPAVEEYRRSVELGSRDPRWFKVNGPQVTALLRQIERFGELDARLPALLKGQEQPRDAGERLPHQIDRSALGPHTRGWHGLAAHIRQAKGGRW
jgi:predicted TPR repeat methyltransferase